MKALYLCTILFLAFAFAACNKGNSVSKIPQISLMAVEPLDTMHVNVDTCGIEFSLVDGDGDIGNDTTSGVWLKDSRFPANGFTRSSFPDVDPSIEDPKKGLQGTCIFFPFPQPTPRTDSLHMALGDTFTYELYITDRAGHQSNHITTHPIIVLP